ncbi:MAG: response regulator transcription factor [Anaerolineales bacterium]|nr:response regulator transcription factor [Anaerolineales bacterium]
MTENILLIESARLSAPSFAPSLEKKGYFVTVINKVRDVKQVGTSTVYDLVILDAASMQTTGYRMCKKLAADMNGVPIILVTPEGTGDTPESGSRLVLEQPFTSRKLLNRVVRFLPGEEGKLLKAGPITLSMNKHVVRCLGNEEKLTPKQAELLKLFMKNPGRVMTRAKLIKLVWDTEYTGDTRTLDVHMSWLRKAIEPDPDNPRFFVTIRGVGYRMDLPKAG